MNDIIEDSHGPNKVQRPIKEQWGGLFKNSLAGKGMSLSFIPPEMKEGIPVGLIQGAVGRADSELIQG